MNNIKNKVLTDRTLVSVVIPVYNCADYLYDCLLSLQNQTFKNWECIIVDDGSTDGSGEICDRFQILDDRFYVIHQNNEGVSSARNIALNHIHGKYCMFLDADDCIDTIFIEHSLKMINNTGSDIVQHKYCRDRSLLGKNHNCEEQLCNQYPAETVQEDILKFQIVDPLLWGKLYKTDVLKDLRFKPQCYVLEDVEFLTRVMLRATVCTDGYVGYYYRETAGSLIKQGLNRKKLLGSIASQNACIEDLRSTNWEERAYCFKYVSLFNWLIRSAKQEDWREL